MTKLKSNLPYLIFSIFIFSIAVASSNYYRAFNQENERVKKAATKMGMEGNIISTKNMLYPTRHKHYLPDDNFPEQKLNSVLNFYFEIWEVWITARNSFPTDNNDLIYYVDI